MKQDMPEHNTQPGDLIGRDSNGRISIRREIPLHWLIGIVAIGVAQAFAQFYGLAQLKEQVAEFRVELRAMRAEMNLQNNLTAIHTYQITNLEQRMSQLERKQP